MIVLAIGMLLIQLVFCFIVLRVLDTLIDTIESKYLQLRNEFFDFERRLSNLLAESSILELQKQLTSCINDAIKQEESKKCGRRKI